MFITLTNPTNEEASLLQPAIDNTSGGLYVALREIHYEVRYSNLGKNPYVVWVDYKAPENQRRIFVPPGLFTPERLSQFFMDKLPGLKMEIDGRGFIWLDTTETGGTVTFMGGLGPRLGIRKAINGEYHGDRPIKLSVHRWLYIYLNQLSTTSNLVNGAPSTLLAIIPAATSGVTDITIHKPMYRKLEAGHVHNLNLLVLDEDGKEITNDNKPITIVLEILENA